MSASERPDSIPLVSIAPIAANVADADITENDFRQVGEELVRAFTETGFCYIADHGVDETLLNKCFDVSKAFFALPLEIKKRCLRGDGAQDYYGWLPKPFTQGIDRKPEAFDPNRPPDYKETLNISDDPDDTKCPTNDEVPGFRATTLDYSQIMHLLSERVLLALGHGLHLDDPQGLLKKSLKIGTRENYTQVRCAYYPRISSTEDEQGLWCSEHTDIGFITILLDNGVSGLQIKTRDGKYVMVPKQEGAFVVNIADSLERVTGGILRSAPHRVVSTDESCKEERYSIIYFRVAENSVFLDPMCGAKEKYQEKITAMDYITRRMKDYFYGGEGIGKNTSE